MAVFGHPIGAGYPVIIKTDRKEGWLGFVRYRKNNRNMPQVAQDIAQFGRDVVRGLTATPKFLPSKYFYDTAGDRLFQKIMEMPEYYVTRAEYEIFRYQSPSVIRHAVRNEPVQLIELGAGDGTKTQLLLREMLQQGIDFTYHPIDISANALGLLSDRMTRAFGNAISVKPVEGDYFNALSHPSFHSDAQKLILFLGSTIGNFQPDEASSFIGKLSDMLDTGDRLLIGFDLKKHPQTILDAYNDKQGITKAFNLNLLKRINRELNADFIIDQFIHFPVYDPVPGAAKSYLVSLKSQEVYIRALNQRIFFTPHETIYMEISQKFDSQMIRNYASCNGLSIVQMFTDNRNMFADVLFEKS